MSVRLAAVAAVLALTLACGGNGPAKGGSEEASAVDVEAVVKVAKAIKADPASAEAALKEGGFTRKAFEDALYLIAEDPKLTQKYAKLLSAK